MSGARAKRRLAVGLGGTAVAEAAYAIAATIAVGWTFRQALDAFVVSNIVIGVGFALCGALIAYHRPRHPVGWLYAVGGTLQLLTAAAGPTAAALREAAAPSWLVRAVLTIFNYSWPVHIGIVLPLSLLLLPDGRLPSPRWRALAVAVVATAPLFVLEIGLSPRSSPAGLPPAYLTLPSYDHLGALWTVSEVRWAASMLAGVAAVGIRYRRGDERLRRQILWLVAAAGIVLVAVTPWALVAGTPVVVLFTIPLLPVAITIGVLRHQLLDIRLVLARGVAYAVLSIAVLGAYAALVVVLSGVASALLVALAALPLRSWLQRQVERLLYGQRADPLRVASRVGGRLDRGVADTLEEMREALRLPYAAVSVGADRVASAGHSSAATTALPLGGDAQLIVGLRAGERRLDPSDQRVLQLLAGPLASAVRATLLSQDLQSSRERLVAAREEERRRLRRDLHDGLGPLLTGVALSADAAANLVARAPAEAADLLAAVRAESRTAIGEIRRLIDDLRPPALDELGLVGALEARAARTVARSDGGRLHAVIEPPAELPPLPAAIEVAAYRIVTEAMTNAARHSDASTIVVRVACGAALTVEIADDGTPGPTWTAGLGINDMCERVAELGGTCSIGPSRHGGRVLVSLPLVRG